MIGPHPAQLVATPFSLRGGRVIVLVGLCLLAFGLRVARLDFHPIWFDEDLAYQRATASLGVSLASMAGSPLYYVLLRGWVELTGVSLFALRYFSTSTTRKRRAPIRSRSC